MEQFAKLIARIESAKAELGNPETIWYRGLSNPKHTLIPSLFRYSNGREKEQTLFEKFKRAQPGKFKIDNDWETLFYMQHYGIPTRLLDWSEVLGVAFFFATRDPNASESILWLLNPNELNLQSNIASILTEEGKFIEKSHAHDDKRISYYDLAIKKNTIYDLPISIFGNYIDSRIVAQKGCFTIHGSKDTVLDAIAPKALKKITITKDERNEILQFLQMSDINEFSIFPGIIGLAPYLKSLVDLQMKESTSGITPIEENKNVLTITKAIYGTHRKSSNVTQILKKQVQNGKLDIIANNDLFGDSHEGFLKRLEVDYEFNGSPGRITIPEHSQLILP